MITQEEEIEDSPKAVAVIKCFGTGLEFEENIHQLTKSKMNYCIFNDPVYSVTKFNSPPVNEAGELIEQDLSKRCFFCQLEEGEIELNDRVEVVDGRDGRLMNVGRLTRIINETTKRRNLRFYRFRKGYEGVDLGLETTLDDQNRWNESIWEFLKRDHQQDENDLIYLNFYPQQ